MNFCGSKLGSWGKNFGIPTPECPQFGQCSGEPEGKNLLPVLDSLFSSYCRVGIVLTSVFCYFALLGNHFVYLVMFHSGSSMNFDLKSVLSMAERI